MKNSSRPIVLCLVIIFAAGIAAAQGAMPNTVPGELLVKFASGTSPESVSRAHRSQNGTVVERIGRTGWQRIKLPPGTPVNTAAARYARLENVAAAQPNFTYKLLATPNDPDFSHTGMYGLLKISAPAAWDVTTGSETVVVANIDTGMRYTHEDLAANIWTNAGEVPNNGIDDDNNGYIDDYYGWDFRYDDSDPIDEHGHGTHTAGTIGAVGNNGVGVVGVNWNVRLMTIKIYSSSGGDTTTAMLIHAYEYVLMMKNRGVNIRVTNNSYGGCAEACGYDQATKDAIDALGDAGILNVFAAGNSGTDNDAIPHYPSSYDSPSILAVAASNSSDNRIFNYGLNSVDLAAPGVGIRSTRHASDSSYGQMSGTSMATPHVSGAAALLASLNPKLSAASLKATLMNTVDQLPQWSGLVRTGGRLNVAAALNQQTVCSLALSAATVTPPTKGGVFTITVDAPANCDYRAKSDKKWIHVINGGPFSGNGEFQFRVTVNSTISRTGTIMVGDREITVTQSRK